MKALNKMKEALDLWQEGQTKFDLASKILSSGPASFYYEKLDGYVSALFNKYAPFKEGDRVKITKKLNFDNSPGWSHCTHFLVKGAIGEVKEVDYRDDQFTAYVVWDNETWISSIDGKEHAVTDKHQFHMWEGQIKKITNE